MKKLVILGVYDKKIFLPFLSAAFLILTGYIGGFVPKSDKDYYIGDFGTSFGFMLAIFLPCVFRIDTDYSICGMFTKSSIKDYSIFLLLYAIFRSCAFVIHFTEYDLSRVSALCSNQSLEII